MLNKKNRNYIPLTAVPFKQNAVYKEVDPCGALRTYIRCFWGSEIPYVPEGKEKSSEIVIPDTCVDIIYYIDYTENRVSGGFCGINDRSFYAKDENKRGHLVSVFAIRFYSWSAYLFAGDSFENTVNGWYEIESRFAWLDRQLRSRLFEMASLQEKISYAEKLLVNRLQNAKRKEIVDNTVNNILMRNGVVDAGSLAREAFISGRQLERLFHAYIGITPKKLSNLIRYQFLWRDILCERDFCILDAVAKYGYTDQPHLLREFKRYHSVDIKTALSMAFDDVGNLQDKQMEAL